MKKVILAGFILLGISVFALGMLYSDKNSSSEEGVDFIRTNNYANLRLEFYYYLPREVLSQRSKKYPLLVCVPGLSGRGERFVKDEFKEFARKSQFIIIAPSFIWDRENWNQERSYQYPAVWSGEAFLRIVEKLKNKYKLSVDKFYLFGFSAGAQFCLRFALWRPELVSACAAFGSGGSVIPQEKIEVKFLIGVGKDDKIRIGKAKGFYFRAQDLGIDVDYKEYEGLGHSLSAQQVKDALDFFAKVREEEI